MTTLTPDALNFAKSHIESYYDSDFFPRPPVFDALWAHWPQVSAYLLARNIEKLPAPSTRVLAAPKARGGFRMAHQLDPVSAIVYTALGYMVAPTVETARVPTDEGVLFSYRIAPDTRSFFADGNGYNDFVDACRTLADKHAFVLTADLADFYGRIYLHRLQNNLEGAGVSQSLATGVEKFLLRLNMKASQGIPVGPSASIVMAEASLIDVDDFLRDRSLPYLRYVDDLRVFGDNLDALHILLEDLVTYLHHSHRLQIAWNKTAILSAEEYRLRLDSPEKVEQRAILGVAREFAAYPDSIGDEDAPKLVERFMNADEAPRPPVPPGRNPRLDLRNLLESYRAAQEQQRKTVRKEALARLLRSATDGVLDLGLARYVLRRSRALGVTDVLDVALERFERLTPACADLFLYLAKVAGSEASDAKRSAITRLTSHPAVARSRFVRHWLNAYFASDPTFAGDREIRSYLKAHASIEHQAQAALVSRNVSWVRSHKGPLCQRSCRLFRAA